MDLSTTVASGSYAPGSSLTRIWRGAADLSFGYTYQLLGHGISRDLIGHPVSQSCVTSIDVSATAGENISGTLTFLA